MPSPASFISLFSFGLIGQAYGLTVYTGSPPNLPSRKPFGFASKSTGGSLNASATYLATNAAELREALALPYTKTVYVKGVINGNELSDGTRASCQTYIDNTGSAGAAIRTYNFTEYIYSLNSTYLSLVSTAAAENKLFNGRNATEYRAYLGKLNGWRPVVSNTQKAAVGFTIRNNTSLIGLDSNAALNGINLYLNSVDNIWIRNLKLVSPADCFPAPETFPSSWNAKFDAVGLVTATNVWVDGCELQDQLSGEYVEPDVIPPGWEVDRFDGLFDCEDGSDNVTFSHNIIKNHHKSLLLGGGTKEADRDLGKMHFTIFGNHFQNSASRNPLMRFGSYDIAANLFESVNNNNPVYKRAGVPADAVFQYHMGVYNQSQVQLQDNVFVQTGSVPNDTSRIFTVTENLLSDRPTKLCVRPGSFTSTMNTKSVDLLAAAKGALTYAVGKGRAVADGIVFGCSGFAAIGTPPSTTFTSYSQVQSVLLTFHVLGKSCHRRLRQPSFSLQRHLDTPRLRLDLVSVTAVHGSLLVFSPESYIAMVATCESENTEAIDQSSFWDQDGIHWDAHRIGWAVSGAFALAAVIVTIVSVGRHARHYYVPKEQRQIIRILYMPLVYAIISWLSYRFFRAYTYYSFVVIIYEAITISAFMLLIIQYVASTSSGKTAEGALARKDKEKLPIPFCCWRYRPTKAYFMYTIKWSVLQYVIIRPTVSIIGIICEALHILCQSSWSYKHPSVYLTAVDFVSISVALYGLILFYDLTKHELKGRRPLAKFLTIKLIVMCTFYQEFVFDALQNHGIIKATNYWTGSNIADGLNALAITIEMVLFAFFMMWAYPISEYIRPELPKTSAKRAIMDSLNFGDFIAEIWGSLKFFYDYFTGKPHTRGMLKPDTPADFGEAFGVHDASGNLRTRGGSVANAADPEAARPFFANQPNAPRPSNLSGTRHTLPNGRPLA
ncbi:polysaccharide lyase family 1 protein [Rhizoctonia solani AG-3 Rhs1AP]|uniref:Polysaccharide lyase family 1 protein n=1 Tax=Rhizoctonia solani AG-3 Rhs1AP TaxID=1086054 RepID=X8JN99_9AGAM|nr:polysaccharide lyase family 1 protein [Rhizoctonia solani AG-3 Rhs1AP]